MADINKEKVAGVIFDYGGTIDSRGDHWSEVIWEAYQKASVKVEKQEFRNAYVYAERELAKVRHILPHHNFYDLLLIKMQIELSYLVENWQFALSEVGQKAEEIAGYCYNAAKSCVEEARPILEQLSAKYPMVLVSNFYGNVEAVLGDFDINKYFIEIVESAVVGVRKPDPEIFRLGVKALGVPAENILVIGDSYKKDIIPAETIGCQVLWLKGKGWTPEEDAQTHKNIILALSDVVKLLL